MRNDILKILTNIIYDKKKSNEVIDYYFENKNILEQNKPIIKRETFGVLEKIKELDNLIAKYSKIKIEKIDKFIMNCLRLGIYELLYMDKIPEYATINEIVNIVKKSKYKNSFSYVNAVLRNVDRENKKNMINENKKENKNCYFRIYNNNEKIVIDELNSKNIPYKKYEGKLSFDYAKVYKVEKYSDILNLESFKDGNILIEDASSIFFTDILTKFIKEREENLSKDNQNIKMMKLLDTCSAPGGKILGLIDLIYDDYFYFYAEARDISESKILKICENINRLKVLDLNMLVKDASIYDELDNEKYDVVMCDVPCTGLGVSNKKPDILINYSDEKKMSLVELQKKILNASKNYVKVGGILTYSTCTETKEENELLIKEFLENNKNFEKLFEKQILKDDENNADGFYMCIMKRI